VLEPLLGHQGQLARARHAVESDFERRGQDLAAWVAPEQLRVQLESPSVTLFLMF